MKLKDLSNKVGGLILSFFVLFGVGLISSTTAQAQWQRGQSERDRRVNRDERNRRDHDRDNRDWNRERNRRRTNDAYRNNNVYRSNNGYGTYGGYGNNGYGNYSQVAVNQGYQAGLNTGASDAQRGQSYNPQRSHYYKNPPNNSSYGNDQAFRQGFLQGYREGYQRYGGRYNNGRSIGTWFPW